MPSKFKSTRFAIVVMFVFALSISTSGQQVARSEDGAGYSSGGVITSVPRSMTYHGTLYDSGGDPVANQTVDIIFRIYDDPNTGELEWDETINGVQTDDVGRFSTELSNLSIPFDEDYWLELEIVGDTGPMTPRQKINMVGYAASRQKVG